MQHGRTRISAIVVAACIAALLVAVPSAQAAVTVSHITSPADYTWFVYNDDNPNTFAVSGTTNGTTGDHVDIDCYDGNGKHVVAGGVTVAANGSFTAPAAPLHPAVTTRICNLHAVPAGTTPVNASPYPGPRIVVDETQTSSVSGGPNNGHKFDFYALAMQRKGGFDYDSLGSCGIDDSYLLDESDSLSAVPFYCNAWLTHGGSLAPTRSQLQIDGANAYTPYSAKAINSAASGLPTMTYSYHLNPANGNFVIHDTEQLKKCPNAAWPPTAVTCPSFASTGVVDHRTITQDHDALVAWVTDIFTSTDGKAHTLDLLWQNDQHFVGDGSGYSAANVEYQFPGQSSYSTHLVNDQVALPSKPGIIRIRMKGTPDGDVHSGRGAIVYDRPASGATFDSVSTGQSDFTLHQTVKVPAHGSARVRFAYVQNFQGAEVEFLAQRAATIFKGCTVPKVAGKTLAAAKSALTHAHCAVGKITQAYSSTVPDGSVISSSPKAGSKLDYQAKVALVVSKGKN